MSTEKLTDAQIRMMQAVRDTGSAYIPGNGGGRDQTFGALIRKGLVTRGTTSGVPTALTEAGAEALAQHEAAVEAARPRVRPITRGEQIRRRVASAAARFIAEARDGNVGYEPTDANLAEAFAHVVRPISPDLYGRVRYQVNKIRAERAQEGTPQ